MKPLGRCASGRPTAARVEMGSPIPMLIPIQLSAGTGHAITFLSTESLHLG